MNHTLTESHGEALCTVCGQAGLELEDECPGGAILTPPTTEQNRARSSLPKATAKTPILRDTISTLKANASKPRKSFNRAQLGPMLEQAAAAIGHVRTSPKTTREWNGEELRLILAAHGLRVLHEDDANVGPCCGLCLEPKQ